jgi:hypothetical protein
MFKKAAAAAFFLSGLAAWVKSKIRQRIAASSLINRKELLVSLRISRTKITLSNSEVPRYPAQYPATQH